MLTITWSEKDGWEAPQIKPFQNLSLHPASSALHYSIEVRRALCQRTVSILMFCATLTIAIRTQNFRQNCKWLIGICICASFHDYVLNKVEASLKHCATEQVCSVTASFCLEIKQYVSLCSPPAVWRHEGVPRSRQPHPSVQTHAEHGEDASKRRQKLPSCEFVGL